jgi:hypothetical protein
MKRMTHISSAFVEFAVIRVIRDISLAKLERETIDEEAFSMFAQNHRSPVLLHASDRMYHGALLRGA